MYHSIEELMTHTRVMCSNPRRILAFPGSGAVHNL